MSDRLHLSLLALFLFIAISNSISQTPKTIGDDFDSFLSLYVKDGLADYRNLKQNSKKFDTLVSNLASVELQDGLPTNTRLSFWINAYNILVIHSVITAYPITSPMDVQGFFDKKKHAVAGRELTLNDIENGIIRPQFKDARIHFALVCAARGCPIIVDHAYEGKSLDDQLAKRATATLNDSRHVRLDKGSEKVLVSEIFKWYRDDFVTETQTVIDYINQYRKHKIPTQYTVEYIPYDWTLNEKR